MKKSKFYNYLIIVAVIFVALIWGTVYNNISANSDNVGPKIYFLDVGQGDATLLNLPNSVQVLIDMGRGQQTVDQLSRYMPYFDRNIEYAFISHFDADHFGGLDEVLESYDIENILYPLALAEDEDAKEIAAESGKFGYKVEEISRGDVVYFNESAKSEILWPQGNEESLNGNDLSAVFIIEGLSKKVLMTGDIEKRGQVSLLGISADSELKADILKFPHHGAEGAFGENFLQAVDPAQVVISVGNNSYGHPSENVIDYFEKLNKKVLRTDMSGTVEFAL